MSFSFRSALLYSASLAALTAGSLTAQAQTTNGGGSTLATPTYQGIFTSLSLAPPSFNYYPSGSGAAQTAFLNNSIGAFGAVGVTTGAVDFGASDATLSSSQISTFSTTYGYPLIQVPSFGTPITLAFNFAGRTTNGALTLPDTTASKTTASVCSVLSGAVTDVHAIDSSVPAGTKTIQVEYRSDSSGTTFLLTQHLAAVCTATNSAFSFSGATALVATKTFASLFATVPSNFHGASGSSGVEAAVNSTSNSIGYLSPDYTRIALANAANSAFPVVLGVTNSNNSTTYQPSTAATVAALAGALFPNFDASGVAHPTTTLPTSTVAANPANLIPIAANPTSGYPIVGYTTLELSTCYANATVASNVIKFLNGLYDSNGMSPYTKAAAKISNNGFVQVPGASATAAPTAGSFAADLITLFITGPSNPNLVINNTTACTGKTGR